MHACEMDGVLCFCQTGANKLHKSRVMTDALHAVGQFAPWSALPHGRPPVLYACHQTPCVHVRTYGESYLLGNAKKRQNARAEACLMSVCVCVIQVSAGRSVRALYGIIYVDNQLSEKVSSWLHG